MINQETLKEETQKAVDKAMEIVTSSIQSVEKLTKLQLDSTRQILTETSVAFKELGKAEDPKAVFNKISEITTKALEKNIATAKDAYEILNEVRTKLSRATEEHFEQAQQAAISSVEGFAKFNPQGAQLATESLKSWINSANQAISAMNKAAHQFSEFTSNNFTAVTNAAMNATKKPSSTSK